MNSTAKLIMADGTEYPVSAVVTIGRSDDCDIVLTSSRVSRQHARVTATEDGLLVEDLGSSNGTAVNHMTISAATGLLHGDRIGIDEFELTVVIDGAADDATELALPADDATELAIPQPTPAAAMVQAAAETAGAALPGSWAENDGADHTEFFSDGAEAETVSIARHSTLPHLVVLGIGPGVEAVLELDSDPHDGEQAWIIGRDPGCDLVLEDATVSTRHAQLVQTKGRWRMVNLVSSNGILVNGEKRLTVYLSSGDTVQLGRCRIVFFDREGASSAGVAARPTAASPRADADAGRKKMKFLPWVVAGFCLLAGAAYLLMN